MSQPSSPPAEKLRFGPFRLDPLLGRLRAGETEIALTRKTSDTLAYLARNAGRLVTREELIEAVWPNVIVEEGNLHGTVSAARKALAQADPKTGYIETVRGLGYRFTRPVAREAAEAEFAQSDPPPEPARSAPAPRAWPRRLALVGAVLAVAGFAAVALSRLREPARPWIADRAPGRLSVAVVGFRNLSSRPEDAWLSSALSEMIRADLCAGDGLSPVPGEDVARMKRELALVDESDFSKTTLLGIRRNLGTDLVVSGSFLALGGDMRRLRLDVHLQDPAAATTIAVVSRTGTEVSLFELVADVGAEMRRRLGLAAPDAGTAAATRAVTPSRPEAARPYAEAMARLAVQDAQGALPLVRRAVEAEPDFAAGRRALVEALRLLGREKEAGEEALQAVRLAGALPEEERLSLEGEAHAATKDWDRSIASYERLRAIRPASLDYGVRLATVQLDARRPADAKATLAALRKSVAGAPSDARVPLLEARAFARLSDYTGELAAAEEAEKTAANQGAPILAARAALSRGRALAHLGRFQDAAGAAARARPTVKRLGETRLQAELLWLEGNLAYYVDDVDEASRKYAACLSLQRALGAGSQLLPLLTNLANVERRRGELLSEEQTIREALVACGQAGRSDCQEQFLEHLGRIAFVRGRVGEAEELGRKALEAARRSKQPTAERQALLLVADARQARGDLREAERLYRETVRMAEATREQAFVRECQANLVEFLENSARHAEAAELSRRILATLPNDDSAARYVEPFFQTTLARALAARGDPAALEEAGRRSDRAYELAGQKRRSADVWLYALSGRAEVLAARGDRAGARAVQNEVLAFAEPRGFEPATLRAKLFLSRLDFENGAEAGGANRVEEIRARAESLGLTGIGREAASLLRKFRKP